MATRDGGKMVVCGYLRKLVPKIWIPIPAIPSCFFVTDPPGLVELPAARDAYAATRVVLVVVVGPPFFHQHTDNHRGPPANQPTRVPFRVGSCARNHYIAYAMVTYGRAHNLDFVCASGILNATPEIKSIPVFSVWAGHTHRHRPNQDRVRENERERARRAG